MITSKPALKYMWRILLPAVIVLFVSFSAQAQKKTNNPEDFKKELQEFKLKYLLQEMDLQGDKQKEFVQLYSKYDEERDKVFREIGQKTKALKNMAKPTENDYMNVVDAMTEAKVKEGELEKNYTAQFKKFLTAEQLYKLKHAEHKFMKKVMEMRGKKGKQK